MFSRPSSNSDIHTDDRWQLEQRNRELSILNTIAAALNRSVALEEALNLTLNHSGELLGLDTGWIWLLNEKDHQTYLAASKNLPPGLAQTPERMAGSCYCLDTYRSGDMDGAANISVITCSRLKALVDGTDGLRYHASIPLYAGAKQLGVLNLASKDWRELSQADLRLLYIIGDLLSIAIERARLFAQRAQYGAYEERNRLAREIHDTLAQGLSAIAMQLETADALLEDGTDPAGAQLALGQALVLTRSNLEEARRSVLDLRAAPLEGRTLGQALEGLARSAADRSTFAVGVEIVGDRPLPTRIEAGLYRITQEALSNVRQHAQASQVQLFLTVQPDQIILSIRDDGRGFDLSESKEEGFGLIGLNERARLLGGLLKIQSGAGNGTQIDVLIPLEEKA